MWDWPLLRERERKGGKGEIWREQLWSDGVDWAVWCCLSEKRWQDKTLISDSGNEITTFGPLYSEQWSGFNSRFPTLWRGLECEYVDSWVMWPEWPRGVEQFFPSSTYMTTTSSSKPLKFKCMLNVVKSLEQLKTV